MISYFSLRSVRESLLTCAGRSLLARFEELWQREPLSSHLQEVSEIILLMCNHIIYTL